MGLSQFPSQFPWTFPGKKPAIGGTWVPPQEQAPEWRASPQCRSGRRKGARWKNRETPTDGHR